MEPQVREASPAPALAEYLLTTGLRTEESQHTFGSLACSLNTTSEGIDPLSIGQSSKG